MPGQSGVYTTVNPAYTGSYAFSLAMAPGVVAANNFIALANPVGSPRVVAVNDIFISSVIVNDVTATADPMRGYRGAVATGGSLASASAICKMRSSMPASTAEIRTGNPSVTLDGAWFTSPPVIGASKTSSAVVDLVSITCPGGQLTLLPGESTVFRTESGDVDQRWNITVTWSET